MGTWSLWGGRGSRGRGSKGRGRSRRSSRGSRIVGVHPNMQRNLVLKPQVFEFRVSPWVVLLIWVPL